MTSGRDQYGKAIAPLGAFGPVAEQLVGELLAADGIQVHSVRHRIKTAESTGRKLALKSERYKGPEELHDLLGVRVITFFPDEVDIVSRVVEREFEVDAENSVDKRADLAPDRFGYLSRHYVLRLNAARLALPEHAKFASCVFELQIRSILQHAWAEIEHDLGYHAAGVPTQFRRRFSRLAGLLEIADDEFAKLRGDIKKHQESVHESIAERNIDVELDQDSLGAYIDSSDALSGFAEFVRDEYGVGLLPRDDSSLAKSIARFRALGLKTVAEVDQALNRHEKLLRPFAKLWIEGDFPGPVPSSIGLFYLCYLIAASTEDLGRIEAYLTGQHIGIDDPLIAQRLLDVYNEARASI